METRLKPRDIVVYPTMFGDWEFTNAENYFAFPKDYNKLRVSVLRKEDGYNSFEDCKRLIEMMQPIPEISIVRV